MHTCMHTHTYKHTYMHTGFLVEVPRALDTASSMLRMLSPDDTGFLAAGWLCAGNSAGKLALDTSFCDSNGLVLFD